MINPEKIIVINLMYDVGNFLEKIIQYPITQITPAKSPDQGPLLSVNTSTDNCNPMNKEEIKMKV